MNLLGVVSKFALKNLYGYSPNTMSTSLKLGQAELGPKPFYQWCPHDCSIGCCALGIRLPIASSKNQSGIPEAPKQIQTVLSQNWEFFRLGKNAKVHRLPHWCTSLDGHGKEARHCSPTAVRGSIRHALLWPPRRWEQAWVARHRALRKWILQVKPFGPPIEN